LISGSIHRWFTDWQASRSAELGHMSMKRAPVSAAAFSTALLSVS
jgi:hypothetical protein